MSDFTTPSVDELLNLRDRLESRIADLERQRALLRLRIEHLAEARDPIDWDARMHLCYLALLETEE